MTEPKNYSLNLTSESFKYWQQQLVGSPPLLELPIDSPRQSLSTYQQAICQFTLSGKLLESVQTLAADRKLSLFVTLLAAFKVLLYRYSDRQDIMIGSPIANRNLGLIAGVKEAQSDWLVLRTDLSGNPSFEEVLQRVGSIVTESRAYHNLAFDRLVELLNIPCEPSYHPIFQVMFGCEESHDRFSGGEALPTDLAISPISVDTRTDRGLDLALKLIQTPTEISGYLEYRTDLFTAATIERMVGHFQTLLGGIVANPAQSIDELPLLTDAERQQLLVEWNDTQADYPQDVCIHQLFEAQVLKTPDAIAVVFEQDVLTYAQLNRQANQLAHHLQALGANIGVLVGICVERSVEMVVGLLGILKAGAAYVPIDPNYPTERIAYLLADSQVKVLLTQARLLDTLPPTTAHQICLDRDWEIIAQQQPANPNSGVNFSHIAYVIYTSGSTGNPKGVKIYHKGFANYLNWCIQAYTVDRGTGSPVQSSISFDATITSIFSPLLVGQKVVLLPEKQEIEALVSLLQSSDNFSLIKITPAHLEILKYLLQPEQAQGRTRALIVGGEALLGNNLAFWLKNAPQTKIINEYGPTETVVGCCVYEVTKATCLSTNIPIGRPIANTQLYVLDRLLQPVPIGIKGELYIGGDGVAAGYLGREELTKERFIPNPFSDDPQARIYKTGDLARYLPDGNLDYLGRIDSQVKIRGYRIELGEIETILSQHPDVDRLAVVVNDDIPGNKRLIAYIVPHQQQQPTIDSLREFLAQKLPEHAIPAVFVLLDTFPLTPNGKIDRRALPAPESLRTESTAALAAPRDELEQELTQIWERILGVESIGIGENFFELGGNSLIAVRLFAEIEDRWHRNLPLATLLQYPTIAELADRLRQEQDSNIWPSLVPISSSGTKPPLFCIHPIGGNILEFYPLARLGLDRPIYGLQSLGLDGVQAPLRRIEDMAARYIQEMQTIQPNGPYFLIGYSFGGSIAFEIAQQFQRQGQEIGLLAFLDSASPNLLTTRPSFLQSISIHLHNFHRLELKDRIKYIQDRLAFWIIYKHQQDSEKGFVLDRGPELLPPEYLEVLAANFDAGKEYTGKFYPGSVTLFRSDIQPIYKALHPDLGWGELVGGDVTIEAILGHHNNLLQEPHLQFLAEKLRSSLV
jgi:amino acid adenylation domain-containing protein